MSRKITQEAVCDICGYIRVTHSEELPYGFSELTLGVKDKKTGAWRPFGPTFIVCEKEVDGGPVEGHDKIRKNTFFKMFRVPERVEK